MGNDCKIQGAVDFVNAETFEELKNNYEKIESIKAIHEKVSKHFGKYVFHSKERDNENRGLIWYCRDGKMRWDGIAGRLRDKAANLKINIRTPFDQNEKNYFMAYLLMEAFNYNGSTAPFENTVTDDDILHFLYIYLFKNKLKNAYTAGLYKKYETFERNDDHVRGHIDVSRHIKLNMGLANGKIAYSYRERTTDNNINRLILHTFELLRHLYPGMVSSVMDLDRDFNAIVNSLQFECPSWQTENVRTAAAKSVMPITQPLFNDYEELRKLCLRILSNEGISVFGEESEDDSISDTILFYVPDYWELYLEKIIQRAIDEINSENYTGVPQLKLGSQETVKIIGDIASRRTDFVIFRKDTDAPYAVIDAKFKKNYRSLLLYKPFFPKDYNDDVTQCLAYSAILNCDRVGIVFPYIKPDENNKKEDDTVNTSYKHYISNFNKNSYFGFIGLCVPTIKDDDTFDSWKAKIKDSEDTLTKKIKGLLIDDFKK